MNSEGSATPLSRHKSNTGQVGEGLEQKPANISSDVAGQDEASLLRHVQRHYDPAAMRLLRKLREESAEPEHGALKDPLGAVLADEQARLQEREAEIARLGTAESLRAQADLEDRRSVLEDGIAATRHKKSQP